MARQRLGLTTKFSSVQSAARASLGLHCARLESPLATVAARTALGVGRQDMIDTGGESLLTIRCMRKTLHALPVDVASIAHAATRRFRIRDTLRLAHNAHVSANELAAMTDKIISVLADSGELHHRVIEQMVTPTAASPIAARVALKYLWESGDIAYRNRSPVWDAEVRTFSLMRTSFPTFRSSIDEDEAIAQLIAEYFHRYGPATVRDASWWSGISNGHIRRAMQSLCLVSLKTPWSESPCFMLESDFGAFCKESAAGSASASLCLLAHEDVALKAYFETRKRYLGSRPQTAIFNQIGEVLPTVLLAGVAVGRWRWVPSTGRVEISLFRTKTSAQLWAQILPIASQLETRLRADSRRWTAKACATTTSD
jgi:hypothetical protein